MADAVEDRVQRALDQVLETCRTRLSPLEFQLVQEERALLLRLKLVYPNVICNFTVEQLVGWGLPPGAAYALKVVYPSPAAAAANPPAEALGAAAGSAADQFHAAAREVIFPGGLLALFKCLASLGQVLKEGSKGGQTGLVFCFLSCLAQLATVAGAVLLTWHLAGVAAAIAMGVGLSALSIADKSMEYVWYKKQPPLLGAAGVWCVVAVGLGACTLIRIVFWTMASMLACGALSALACICWCLRGMNWADKGYEWSMQHLETAGELLRSVWQLPGLGLNH